VPVLNLDAAYQRSSTNCCSIKKPLTVPESQTSPTATSRSTETTPTGRNTPDTEKVAKAKRNPPKVRTTPDKDIDAYLSKNKTKKNARNIESTNRTDSADTDDFLPPEDKMDSESTTASTGMHGRSDDDQQSDEDDSRLPPHKHQRNEQVQENEDFEESNSSEDADICSRPPSKRRTTHNTAEKIPCPLKTPKTKHGIKKTITHTNTIGSQKKKRSMSSESSADSDIEVIPKKVVYDDSNATLAGDYTLLECSMRQAIHNFSPVTKYKKTIMCWSPKIKTAAAHMLIERHYDEISNMIERYGGKIALENRFKDQLRFLANNERAIQTRQIKSTFLSKQNPECRLAENVIEQELDLDQTQPIRIHKNNIGHIKSISALRDLLLSPKMYQDQVLFNIFCMGLESGNFRQNRQRPYTPLNDLITKAHEAHFRVELYLALSKKSFRHHNTTSASTERVRIFNIAINSVREGREKYMMKAVEMPFYPLHPGPTERPGPQDRGQCQHLCGPLPPPSRMFTLSSLACFPPRPCIFPHFLFP
jgi:hypothetical protein